MGWTNLNPAWFALIISVVALISPILTGITHLIIKKMELAADKAQKDEERAHIERMQELADQKEIARQKEEQTHTEKMQQLADQKEIERQKTEAVSGFNDKFFSTKLHNIKAFLGSVNDFLKNHIVYEGGLMLEQVTAEDREELYLLVTSVLPFVRDQTSKYLNEIITCLNEDQDLAGLYNAIYDSINAIQEYEFSPVQYEVANEKVEAL